MFRLFYTQHCRGRNHKSRGRIRREFIFFTHAPLGRKIPGYPTGNASQPRRQFIPNNNFNRSFFYEQVVIPFSQQKNIARADYSVGILEKKK